MWIGSAITGLLLQSQISAKTGLLGLAFPPGMLPDLFMGVIISVFFYATGSSLVEVLCSPIVEACPFDHKEKVMSLLHSFYRECMEPYFNDTDSYESCVNTLRERLAICVTE